MRWRVRHGVVRLRGFGVAGDRIREFEEVALVHMDALYRLALRLTRSRAEADDVVQETYLRAYRSFDRFNPGTNCRAWLFTILRNAFLNRVRAGRREILEADVEDREPLRERTAGLEPSPEEMFLQTVLHGDIDRALNALPLVLREAVILADLTNSKSRCMPTSTASCRSAR
jgi:RNA polymerase sigma-70 factor, ECF subfamily